VDQRKFTSSVISLGCDFASSIASIHLPILFSARKFRVVFNTRNQHALPQTISSECCSIPSSTRSDNSRGHTCLARCSAVIRKDMAWSMYTSANEGSCRVDVNIVYAWRSGGAALSGSDRGERVAGALNARPRYGAITL